MSTAWLSPIQRKVLFCLGSDGSQQEGNDAEAARLAVAQGLNVKLIIDDNDVTIAGHPSKYLTGCTTAKTLAGQGVTVLEGDGEDLDDLYTSVSAQPSTPMARLLLLIIVQCVLALSAWKAQPTAMT